MPTTTARRPLSGLVTSARTQLPEVPADAIARRRLAARLDQSVQHPLTVVTAPAGYGKTVSLAQWARGQRQRTVRWLSLRPEHEDPDLLTPDLLSAIGGGPVAALLPTTVVLDDVHLVSGRPALDRLANLLAMAPESVSVVLLTRTRPPLSYYRLRPQNVVVQLGPDDLAFTPSETRDLLARSVGRDPTTTQVAAVTARTEGWPLALRHAALDEDGRILDAYFEEEVLRDLPPTTIDWLLSTSVIQHPTASSCDHVTGTRIGRAMLEQLERSSIFLAPVDGARSCYRYHGLFRSFLRRRLRRLMPTAEARLLRRAADWALAHGEVDDCIGYLAEAREWDDIMDVVSERAPALITRGDASSVAGWIATVPEPARIRRVDVVLEQVVALLVSGQVLAAGRALETHASITSTTAGDRAVTRLLRSVWLLRMGRTGRAAEQAALIAHDLDRDGPHDVPVPRIGVVSDASDVLVAASVLRGAALVHEGRDAEAREELGVEVEGAHVRWQVLALGSRAVLAARAGLLRHAEEDGRRALALAGHVDTTGGRMVAEACVALSIVAREHGDLQDVAPYLDRAAAAAQRDPGGAVAAMVANGRALLALATGDPAAGLLVLAASVEERGRPVPTGTLRDRRAILAELHRATGDLPAARSLLDDLPPSTRGVFGARARLALAERDLPTVRDLIDRWPSDGTPEPLDRLAVRAVLADLDGEERAVTAHIEELVSRTEVEGNVGAFRWSDVRRLARISYRSAPTPFLRTVVEQPHPPTVAPVLAPLVEQLTEREHAVLRLLPTQLTNDEMAQVLGVSLNTVKTHLKHIYRKLEVGHRTEAVAAAERIRVL